MTTKVAGKTLFLPFNKATTPAWESPKSQWSPHGVFVGRGIHKEELSNPNLRKRELDGNDKTLLNKRTFSFRDSTIGCGSKLLADVKERGVGQYLIQHSVGSESQFHHMGCIPAHRCCFQ